MRIIIGTRTVRVTGELSDSPTSHLIARSLPLRGTARLWGDEIYFSVPIRTCLENDARQDVEAGDIGYWPEGPALCIFFGPTPASTGPSPRAYSPVNVVGRVHGDLAVLKDVKDGDTIVVEEVP
ncbi:MAG TPA: cyclophilin-like fold protein [Deltaproteobacteria bacterium]|nr:cyclophilin-like fold protein [Deltaproteobacteria bacterium]